MPPELFAFMGLIASGKSTLARSFAESRGIAYYNSDIVRKKIAGLSSVTRAGDKFGQGIYSTEFTRKTYDALLDYAAAELGSGKPVVLDASYGKRQERIYASELAERFNAGCFFIFCRCDEETTMGRLARRAGDPDAVSDADYEIYEKQKIFFEYPYPSEQGEVIEIDTDAPVEELVSRLEAALAE